MRSLTASILLGALFIVLVTPPARADDAAALLAKHKAFVGWQFGDGSVNSLALSRTYTNADGKVAQHASELRVGLAYRRDYSSSKGQGGATGFTGNVFWTTVGNGFTVPMIGDTAKSYLAIDALFMEGTPELPAELRGTATVGSKTVPIIRVSMNGALPMDLYVDPDTGAYVKAVVDPGGAREETIDIHSYTDLGNGKKMIGSWSFDSDKGAFAYIKAQLNVRIDAAQLHPPAPSATWTFANPQPFPIKVTDSRIYVDATINGTPGHFIVDTGAAGIFLTDDFANRARITTIDKSQAFGIGGVTTTLVRKADSVVIGGNTLSNVVVGSLTSHYYYNTEEHTDGMIGFDLFGGAIVDLNLSAHTMTILDPSSNTANSKGGYPITPDLTTGVPVVSAKADDHFDLNATLDTGGLDAVILSTDVENQGANGIHLIVNSENTFLGANATMGGVGGRGYARCGPLAKIQVGPFPYTQVEACESHDWALHDGLIGFDFLKHFDFVFDYPHGVMYLIPHKE
jgi:predicted aspartyl protease